MRGRREGERKKGRERKGVCVCGGEPDRFRLAAA